MRHHEVSKIGVYRAHVWGTAVSGAVSGCQSRRLRLCGVLELDGQGSPCGESRGGGCGDRDLRVQRGCGAVADRSRSEAGLSGFPEAFCRRRSAGGRPLCHHPLQRTGGRRSGPEQLPGAFGHREALHHVRYAPRLCGAGRVLRHPHEPGAPEHHHGSRGQLSHHNPDGRGDDPAHRLPHAEGPVRRLPHAAQ